MGEPTRPNPTMDALGWTLQRYDRDLARVTLLGRYPVKVRPELVEPVQAMDTALIAAGYENPCDWIGSWMYRDIAGTGGLASSHAYAVALDVDYGGDNPDSPDHPYIDRNPHVHRPIVRGDPGFGREWQILERQVDAVEHIKNIAGNQIWTWRVAWQLGDTMHWQPRVGPADCEVDWTTVTTGAPMATTWNDWIEGWVQGLDEEHVRKLHTSGVISGDVDYWIGLLNQPSNSAWRYFYTRAQASVWAKIGG